MRRWKMKGGFLAAMVLALLAAACAGTGSLPAAHPEQLNRSPLCSECHSEWQSAYDHTADFAASHRFQARRDQALCVTCHAKAFCADCHANKEELKPSDKYKDEPWRRMPHRGDYLTRHRIDGRIDPVSCFKCHGQGNDWRCVACHR
jgi:hypothetical protein